MFSGSEAIDLNVRAARDDKETRLANELIANESEATGYTDRWSVNWGQGYPGFAPEHTRLAYWRDELAGALRIHSETIRLGEARLKVGGLGWLTTTARHRDKGIGRRLLMDALNYLAEHQFHLAMMFGRHNVHYPFGFVHCLPDYMVEVETFEALKHGNPYKTRKARTGDVQTLQRIHNDNDGPVACSILRTSGHFAHRAREFATCYVITDDQGRVNAYFFVEDYGDHLLVDEVGVRAPELCGAVTRACGDIAADQHHGRIRFLVPPSHVFARYFLDHPSLHEIQVLSDGGGMMAIINQSEMVESLIPEWEALIAGSVLRDARTEVTLNIQGEPIRIRVIKGAVDCAPSPGRSRVEVTDREMLHLITGYRHAEDLLATRQFTVGDEARLLLATIFPKRNPYVWPFDRF